MSAAEASPAQPNPQSGTPDGIPLPRAGEPAPNALVCPGPPVNVGASLIGGRWCMPGRVFTYQGRVVGREWLCLPASAE